MIPAELVHLPIRLDPVTGCLIWEGPTLVSRAGRVYGTWRKTTAHRAVFELVHGPLPKNLVVDHLCSHTLCVNPYGRHLQAVPQAINVRRGRRTSLVQADVDQMGQLRRDGMTWGAIGARFAVTEAAVRHIVNGRRWASETAA